MTGRDPDNSHELSFAARGLHRVAGVDEVGRGPLAGPVTAAAVVLDMTRLPEGLQDSKRLGKVRRAALARLLKDTADIGIGHATVAEIDEANILQASLLAMRRAIAALRVPPQAVLVDGNRIPEGIDMPARCIVGGDGLSVSIAAASIVAKECRDEIMMDLAQHYPGYGWEHNFGYPTKSHRSALQHLGVTPHHRRSFRPVHNILYQDKSITS